LANSSFGDSAEKQVDALDVGRIVHLELLAAHLVGRTIGVIVPKHKWIGERGRIR